MIKTTPLEYRGKAGIALVVVLGFLSVLTLLIVAFAVTMRTERLAGSSYVEQAQANHLLTSALASAMEQITIETDGQAFPDFSATGFTNALYSIGTLPLENDIDFSIRPKLNDKSPITTNTAGAVEALYIPGFKSENTSVYPEFESACANASWQTVVDYSGTNVIGRMAFIAVNCSGLLDINHAGGYQTTSQFNERKTGLNPAEIQLYDNRGNEVLADINGSGNQYVIIDGEKLNTISGLPEELPAGIALTYNRANFWNRIESFRSIKQINEVAQEINGGSAPITTYSKNFAPYSFFPSTPTPTPTNFLDISLINENNFPLYREALSKNLKKSGIEDTNLVVQCFLDYIDTNNIPQNMQIPCTEMVPMINEIWVANMSVIASLPDPDDDETTTNSIVTLTVSGELHVETWFPFSLNHPTNDFIITTSGLSDTNWTGGSYLSAIVSFDDDTNTLHLAVIEDGPDPSGQFNTESFSFAGSTTNVNSTNLTPSSVRLMMDYISYDSSEGAIDEVSGINILISTNDFPSMEAKEFGGYCIDPRVNDEWDGGGKKYALWETYIDILGSYDDDIRINPLSDTAWGEMNYIDPLEYENTLRLFIRNAPMENAAELGFLSTGEPWRTIRLCGGDEEYPINPVLDYFYAGEPELTNSSRVGLVNMNSQNPDVLASAFMSAPVLQNPEEDYAPDNALSSDRAIELGKNLSEVLRTTNTTLSIIGEAFATPSDELNELTDAEKESIIANTYRLFGWRDNLFTVIVVAQTGKDVNDDWELDDDDAEGMGAIHRALALVWMDPLTKQASVISYIRTDSDEALSGYNGNWGDLLQDFSPSSPD